MGVETTQRHLQMLLIVSSFGESRRRVNHSAAASLKWGFWKGADRCISLNLFSSGGHWRAINRQNDKEGTPLPQIGFDPNAPLVRIHYALDDGKTQT